MITFKELAEPAPGWALERVRNVRAYSGGAYWEVAVKNVDGTIIEYSDGNLEAAFNSAKRAAENYNDQAVAHRQRREA